MERDFVKKNVGGGFNLTRNKILREAFLTFDRDQDGFISFDDLKTTMDSFEC